MHVVVDGGATACDSEAAVAARSRLWFSPGCRPRTVSASRTPNGAEICVWSSALQMIGSSTGIPPMVFGVPLAQPGAGIGMKLVPSPITLESSVWVGD